MAYRTLDMTLHSARDLNKANYHSTKMEVFAVVSIILTSGDGSSRKKTLTTPVDYSGGANPKWNCQMKFTVDEAALQMNLLSLHFKLVAKGQLWGNHDIGLLNIPLKVLLASTATDGSHFFTHRVWMLNGEHKGHLSFSCKFTTKTIAAAAALALPPNAKARADDRAKAKAIADKANEKVRADRARAKAIADKAEEKVRADRARAKAVADKANEKVRADRARAKAIADKAEEKVRADRARAKAVADKANEKVRADRARAKAIADREKAQARLQRNSGPTHVQPRRKPAQPYNG